MCARAATAPSCSGFTIGQIRGITGHTPETTSYLTAMAATKSPHAAVDEIVRTWFHRVQSFR